MAYTYLELTQATTHNGYTYLESTKATRHMADKYMFTKPASQMADTYLSTEATNRMADTYLLTQGTQDVADTYLSTEATRHTEHSDSGESTYLARTIACAVASAAMTDRAAVVIKSLCYYVSAAECWTYE